MAQFSTKRNKLLNNNDDTYEVVMTSAGPNVYVSAGNLDAGTDAFGRLRVSNPHTLFDSSMRYTDSERRWNTKTSGTASTVHDAAAGLLDLNIGSDSGDEIVRQTDRVFSYQPGKSLLVMNTFTMNEPKANLRQRVGYFTKDNGIYIEQDGLETYIVKRSFSTGVVVNTRIAQSDWNVDKLDGTGASGVALDISKSQIMWTDLEWLGVGSVRVGFVHNGQFICCHIFHHANTITGTYMTTATLSCRYEITNTDATSGPSTMKQICSTVISEGGYRTEGLARSASTSLAGRTLPKAQTNFPMISIRLRSGRTEAVVNPKAVDMYGLQATPYKYLLVRGGTLFNATWTGLDSTSSVEYDITADSIYGGTVLMEGIFKGQASTAPINLSEYFDHSLQLTRGIVEADSTGQVFTIVMRATSNNDKAIASLSWQERSA